MESIKVSVQMLPFASKYLTSELQTLRVETDMKCGLCYFCFDFRHSVDHFYSDIQSVEPDLLNAILWVIPLGKNQFELAVQQKSITDMIRDHYTDLTYLRLLSSDPLFTAEFGRSNTETVSMGLAHIRGQYDFAASAVRASNDPQLIEWFNFEVGRIDELLNHFLRQITHVV